MGKTVPQTDEERLRELIREAHEVLSDLRAEEKQAKALVKELVAGVVAEEVASQLENLFGRVAKTISVAEQAISERFDALAAAYLGTEKGDPRPSLEEILIAQDVISFIVRNAKESGTSPDAKVSMRVVPDAYMSTIRSNPSYRGSEILGGGIRATLQGVPEGYGNLVIDAEEPDKESA